MIRKHLLILAFAIAFILLSGCRGTAVKKDLAPEKQAEFIATGKKITMESFAALSGEVMKAIQEGGVQHAVDYCHLQASPIIDSLSNTYKVRISRISDRYRNPANKPDDLDLLVMDSYRKHLLEGMELQPHLEITADDIIYYSPILIISPACLHCHGEPGLTMQQENYDFIRSKYPGDSAINYRMKELRGAWKIVF
jgi:hypothetical protein